MAQTMIKLVQGKRTNLFSSCLVSTRTLSEFRKTVKKEKVDIKRVDDDGTSLLHWFCLAGNEEIVDYLLQARVLVAMNLTTFWTPLHCIVHCDDKMEDAKRANIVQLLIAAGAEVNQQDVNGCTALVLACRSGLRQCAHVLLSNGADGEM